MESEEHWMIYLADIFRSDDEALEDFSICASFSQVNLSFSRYTDRVFCRSSNVLHTKLSCTDLTPFIAAIHTTS